MEGEKMKHKIPNLFLFPVIIMLARLYIDTPEKYGNFKKLSYQKMFVWQWKALDRILKIKP